MSERGSALQEALQHEAAQPFDLARGPVVRVRLAKLGEQDHVLVCTMHHIVSTDGRRASSIGGHCAVRGAAERTRSAARTAEGTVPGLRSMGREPGSPTGHSIGDWRTGAVSWMVFQSDWSCRPTDRGPRSRRLVRLSVNSSCRGASWR